MRELSDVQTLKYPLSISRDEFEIIKELKTKNSKCKNKLARNCYVKMFELFMRKDIDKLEFDEREVMNENSDEGYYNFNVLYSIPELGEEVEIKSDDYGCYKYTYEDSEGNILSKNIQLPLRNWKYKLKRISSKYTFCYFSRNEYLVMKGELSD